MAIRIAGVTDCQKVNCPKGKRGHPGVRRFAARNDRGNRDPVLFAEGTALVFSCTRERHAGRSLRINSTLRIFKLFFGIKHEIIFPERM